MSDVIRIRVYVGTGFANVKHEDIYEVDKEWWESLSEKEKEDELDVMAVDFRNNCIECSAWVMDEGD